MPYFLREKLHYPRGVVRDNGYWEIETDDLPLDPAGWVGEECRVYNINGGYHCVTIKEDDEIIFADGWDELDCSYLLTPESKLGWLAPDGTFYGCAYFEHSMIAERVIHKDEPTLEEEGWVKMYKSQLFPLDAPDYYLSQPRWNPNKRNYLTKAQIDVLLEKGYKIRSWDTRDWDNETLI